MEGNLGKIKIRYGMWIKKNELSVFFKKQGDIFILYIFRIIQEQDSQFFILKKIFLKI